MGEKADAAFQEISELADKVFEGMEGKEQEKFDFVRERMETRGFVPRKFIEWDDPEPAAPEAGSNPYEGFSFRNPGKPVDGAPKTGGKPAAPGERAPKPGPGMGQYS